MIFNHEKKEDLLTLDFCLTKKNSSNLNSIINGYDGTNHFAQETLGVVETPQISLSKFTHSMLENSQHLYFEIRIQIKFQWF